MITARHTRTRGTHAHDQSRGTHARALAFGRIVTQASNESGTQASNESGCARPPERRQSTRVAPLGPLRGPRIAREILCARGRVLFLFLCVHGRGRRSRRIARSRCTPPDLITAVRNTIAARDRARWSGGRRTARILQFRHSFCFLHALAGTHPHTSPHSSLQSHSPDTQLASRNFFITHISFFSRDEAFSRVISSLSRKFTPPKK